MEVFQIQHPDDLAAAHDIRFRVFVDEQRVPRDIELDEHEANARHYLVRVNGKPVGTARWRLTPEGKAKVERCAVVAEARGTGAGAAVVRAALADIPPGCPVYLHAQTSARGFYERLGFSADGPEFDEAGIAHVKMTLSR